MTTTSPSATALTPNQRAGQTKRERTRRQILEATAELLNGGGFAYDEMRIADIATAAGTGTATVHQTFGHKAAIVSELFLALYEPVRLDTQQRLKDAGTNTADVLRDHLRRLSLAAGEKGALTRAYLRAYASEALCRSADAVAVPSLLQPLIESQSLIDRACRNGELGDDYAVGSQLGPLMTVLLLTLSTSSDPETVEAVTDRALNLLLPPVLTSTSRRKAGLHGPS